MEKYEQYWDGGPSGWTIAESEHYIIKGEYEDATLIRKSDEKVVATVGSFYGEPEAGIFDRNEKFCVTVGCGVIVYLLKDPFETYMYDRDTSQWYEFGRGPENIAWIDAVRQISDDEVEITDANGRVRTIKIEI